MTKKAAHDAQNALILRCQRIMEAFAKSDDERDFYLDKKEGFLIYVDLDKVEEDLINLEKELLENKERYCMIPKLTFYETKKIMEGFVNEKVYDIDTKEKLLDIIQSKEARENFLEFLYDHHAEFDKWQQYYQERSRVKIIEWLRQNEFHFVFEEDLDFPQSIIEKLKRNLFVAKANKDVEVARKALSVKAKSYYSNEALNPRPKRGRPPKQTAKLEIEPQISTDIFLTVPSTVRPFLFLPDNLSSSAMSFSSKFEAREDLQKRHSGIDNVDFNNSGGDLNNKLSVLRSLSSRWTDSDEVKGESGFGSDDKAKEKTKKSSSAAKPKKKSTTAVKATKASAAKSTVKKKKATTSKASEKKPADSKAKAKTTKKPALRSIVKTKKPAKKGAD